jgi:hypothetical protein
MVRGVRLSQLPRHLPGRFAKIRIVDQLDQDCRQRSHIAVAVYPGILSHLNVVGGANTADPVRHDDRQAAIKCLADSQGMRI